MRSVQKKRRLSKPMDGKTRPALPMPASPASIVDARLETAFATEDAAFRSSFGELMRNHLSEYVAFHAGKMVFHDTSLERVSKRIDADYPGEFVLIRQVVPEFDQASQFASPE